MDFDEMAYPDDFMLGSTSLKGSRNRQTGEVQIPYTEAPVVRVGDVIVQRNGPNEHRLEVTDVDYQLHSSLEIGTPHPHILALTVRNLAAKALEPKSAPSLHIGSLSAQQVQIGDNNNQSLTISLAEVVKQVASTNDAEAKGLMRKVLENSTVAAVVGAGVSALLGLL
ncbi:hypothetical protein IP87_18495 [beta proteobacterium AAP121]|nr:hypothetical protein IP87_18495 [beta proteobacterium AAP121]